MFIVSFADPIRIHFEEKLVSKPLFSRCDGEKNKPFLTPEPLKSKSSVELMFEEFFNRIKKRDYGDDFLRYKKINVLLKAGHQSMEKMGKAIKIPKL